MPIPRLRRSVITAGAACALLLAGCTPSDSSAQESALMVETEDLTLEGDLRPAAEGRPTVVIIHGSGPQPRDGNAPGQLGLTLPGPVEVYADLADGLSEAGYGATTWDKRTCGTFNDCATNDYPDPDPDLPFGRLVDDVVDVASHVGHDSGPVVLLGHSQGGTLAIAAAAELLREGSIPVAGVILVSTPVPPIEDVLQTQGETLLELVSLVGEVGPQETEIIEGIDEVALEVRRAGDGQETDPQIDGIPSHFWADWSMLSRRAPEMASALEVPVFALGGDTDWNVPPEMVTAWGPFIGEENVLVLPAITHALTRLEVEDIAAIGPEDLNLEVDGSVIDAIIERLEQWD